MPSPISKLLTLADEFPTRKYLSFTEPDDLAFLSSVILALRAALPDIKNLNSGSITAVARTASMKSFKKKR